MSNQDDPMSSDSINFYGQDPLSPEAYSVLESAKTEMNSWIASTVKESTDALRKDIEKQAVELKEKTDAFDEQIASLQTELDAVVVRFQNQFGKQIDAAGSRQELVRMATDVLLSVTKETKDALERKQRTVQKAGAAVVSTLTKFAGIP